MEQEEREYEKLIKVVDEDLAKSTIEILNTGITIQDLALCKKINSLDVLHLTMEKGDKTLERVIMRMRNYTRAVIEVGEFM